MAERVYIGIDFGTTYSSVAIAKPGSTADVGGSSVVVVPISGQNKSMPTYVTILPDNTQLIGIERK